MIAQSCEVLNVNLEFPGLTANPGLLDVSYTSVDILGDRKLCQYSFQNGSSMRTENIREKGNKDGFVHLILVDKVRQTNISSVLL